jgi:transposase InsO family protein
LSDEKKETASAFWNRAVARFDTHGVVIRKVLADNRSCYCSAGFRDALGEQVKHRRTRPYRPQTNGKVERCNRTMLEEWAYVRPYESEAARAEAFAEFPHTDNDHQGHSTLKGNPLMSRLNDLLGQYT